MSANMPIKRMGCYAALKAGIQGDSYLVPFERLVIGLFQKNSYVSIDAKKLCNDFIVEYGFGIPYLPMCNLLSMACKDEFIAYTRSTGRYIPNRKKISQEDFMNIVEQKVREYRVLVSEFICFSDKKYNMAYTFEQADFVIQNFVQEQSLEFLLDKDGIILNEGKIHYILADFLISVCDTNAELLEIINSIIIGNVLADFITYNEVSSQNMQFKNVKVVIDTNFAFRLLGIDNMNRQDIYKTLIKDLQNLGMQIYMFDHSYNEMIGIMLNSIPWIHNPMYDPLLASESTYYFVSNNCEVEDIEELVQNARNQLIQLYNIKFISSSYSSIDMKHSIYEQDLYDDIVAYYKKSNKNFNEDDKKFTIEQDAKSLFLIYQLRKFSTYWRLVDTDYIFITTNKSLARISKLYNDKKAGNNAIPSCITDIYLGTMIWLNNPVQLYEVNKRRLISEAYSAFKPSDALMKKFIDRLRECEAKGELTPDECYMMKISPTVSRKLMENTLGDEGAFDEKTPLMIMNEIKEEAKLEGRKEVQAILDEVNKKNILLECNQICTKIDFLEKSQKQKSSIIDDKRKILNSIHQTKVRCDKELDRYRRLVFSMYIIITLCCLSAIFIIWHIGSSNNYDYLTLISYILSAIYVFINVGYFLKVGKSLNPKDAASTIIEKKRNEVYDFYGYSQQESDRVAASIDEILSFIDADNCEIQKLTKEKGELDKLISFCVNETESA